MLLMIKYSLFLSTFTLVHLFVTYSVLALWFMWSESSTTNTAATTSPSSRNNYDELRIAKNHNQHEQNLTSASQLPIEQDEKSNDVCDNRSSMTGSKTSAKLCTNNLSNLVKNFGQNHRTEIKQQQSQIIALHSDPCWPLIGLLMLNLCLVLDYFWIPFANLRQHFRSFLSGCLDYNLTYVSTLILIQSFPQWLKRIVLAPILQRNLNYLFRFFHQSLLLDQPFNMECFLLAIGLTGLVFRSLGCPRSSSSSLSDEQIHSPQLFRCLSKLFHYLNIVLFRKTRRNHHRRRNDLSRNTARVQIDDDLILSEEDLDLDPDGLEDEDEEDLDSFDLGEDMDRMLIERLFAVPNLWLHTELISNEYIERLPVWNYYQEETRDMLMMVDCNQNFMLITDTSCQSSSSSSSSDDEYLDTKEEQKQEDGRRSGPRPHHHHHRQSSDVDDDDDEDDVVNNQEDNLDCCLKQKPQPKASFNCCANKSIENIVPDLKENVQLTSSIRKKIEKKRRTLIRRRRPTTKTILNDVPQDDNQPSNGDGDGSTRPTWMLDLHQCTVCLDQYQNEQLILGLPCGHNYHQSCIGEWLTRGNHCCPICRWPSYRFKHPRQQQQISEQPPNR